jgi:hypothetical protein
MAERCVSHGAMTLPQRRSRERTSFVGNLALGLVLSLSEVRMAKQSFDPRATLAELEEQHRYLKQQVTYLERRAILTPSEQREATDLKKKKLATKDAIAELRVRYPMN